MTRFSVFTVPPIGTAVIIIIGGKKAIFLDKILYFFSHCFMIQSKPSDAVIKETSGGYFSACPVFLPLDEK